MANFNPDGAAAEESGIFGIGFDVEDSEIAIVPVPWEATCSYGSGASESPAHVIEATKFVELYDSFFGEFYMKGIGSIEPDSKIYALSTEASKLAKPIIDKAGILTENDKIKENVIKVDEMCETMNKYVYDTTKRYILDGKIVGILGGDHSVMLGAIKAHLEAIPDIAILQLDAHADLRRQFEGLKYSHASVMYNVIEETSLQKLVQVGVRGYCKEEYDRINSSNGRVVTFFDAALSEKTWSEEMEKIVEELPENVYISFDIDGLEQVYCPNTGTPMPRGISYNQSIALLKYIVKSGKKIIGFDLVEVATGSKGSESWDAICAANLLYKLCGVSSVSRKVCR